MKLTLWNIGRSLNTWKSKVLGLTIAYASGVVINLITEAERMSQFIGICTSFSKPAILLMWVFVCVTVLVYALARIITYLNKVQSPSARFKEIMTEHTASELNAIGNNELSWGYNKTIHRPKDPMGWLPEMFYVASYQDNNEYQFPLRNEQLPDYTCKQYNQFIDSAFARKCIEQGNNQPRFAAIQIEPGFNKRENKVAVHLVRTNWLSLQFSWNYLRLLDAHNEPIVDKPYLTQIQTMIGDVFLDVNQSNTFLINSFCLHLILETNDGKAILARISKSKQNDYPVTWAATLGEQIEREDFYNTSDNSFYPDFVWRWVKRALHEELRIDETIGEEGLPEIEEYFDTKSLRVLSVDFEGDIYNIALTCVLRLRMDFEQFIANKSIWMDREEATEFRTCNLAEIHDILLNYPGNIHEYHPSTYLRLLMFHLYKTGTKELCRALTA